LALGLALASAVLMAVLFRPGGDSTRIYYGTDTHLFGLMLGVALAFAWAAPHRAGLNTAAWRRWRPVAVGGALLVLVGLMAGLSEDNPWTFRGGILLSCVATAVLIAGLLESHSPWRAVMQLPVLRWLGERSYGIYLWHWPVLMIVGAMFPYAEGTVRGAVTLTAALVTTLLVSEVSYRVIETPVRQHGFRGAFAAAGARMRGPAAALPKAVAASTAILVVLAGVAVATAPEKSETQQAIETAEANLNAQPADASARSGLSGGLAVGTTPATGPEDEAKTEAAVDAPAEAAPESQATTPAEGFSEAVGGFVETREGDLEEVQAAAEQEDAAADEDAAEKPQDAEGGVPDGWHEDDEGLLVPDSSRLTAIGDSLVVTSADGLRWRFPEMNFAAKSNRQWKDANPVLASALAEGTVRDNVIVHFGTNAGVNEKQLREFMDTLGPERHIAVTNLYGSITFVPGSNEIIEDVVADYPNAVVGDWQGTIAKQPEVLQSDRIHPDIEGMHVYAAVVA